MTTFQVTAIDGTKHFRTSSTREYSHAILVKWAYGPKADQWEAVSFCGRADLAAAAVKQWDRSERVAKAMIAPTQKVPAKVRAKAARAVEGDASKAATKLAAKIRKAGLQAKKDGNTVTVIVPATSIFNHYRYYELQTHERVVVDNIASRNRRIEKIIAVRYLKRLGLWDRSIRLNRGGGGWHSR